MEKLKKQLEKLKKIKNWYGEHTGEEGGIQDYIDMKYIAFNKLCDTVDIAIANGYDWDTNDLLDNIFETMDLKSDGYTIDKGIITRGINLLKGDEEAMRNEKRLIQAFDEDTEVF